MLKGKKRILVVQATFMLGKLEINKCSKERADVSNYTFATDGKVFLGFHIKQSRPSMLVMAQKYRRRGGGGGRAQLWFQHYKIFVLTPTQPLYSYLMLLNATM